MITLRRVLVPIGAACNLHCKYCLRDNGKTRVSGFTDLMREFFRTLNPIDTDAVVFTGGEPLLYWKRIIEALNYIPENVNIRIISNGTLLTEEMVRVINERRICLAVSWDGRKATEKLRGVDIMKNEKLVGLMKKVNRLDILSVITKFNTDATEIEREIREVFGSKTVGFFHGLVLRTPLNQWMIDGFDDLEYIRGIRELRTHTPNIPIESRKYAYHGCDGLNVMPNGDVVSMVDMTKKYGTVENTIEEILARKRELGDYEECERRICPIRPVCEIQSQWASPLHCRMHMLDWSMRMQEKA